MLRQVGAGLGRVVPAGIAALFEAEPFAEQWRTSITDPPSPKHQVFVALDGDRVVGFVAFGPVEDDGGRYDNSTGTPGNPSTPGAPGTPGATGAPSDRPELPSVDAEIIALEVDPAHPFDVHAARLLNACADVLALSGASSMRIWAVRGDELRQRFLGESGFAVLGLRRGYHVDDGEIVEDAWWAEIGDPAP